MHKLLEIFRPGSHTARNGASYQFTDADLQAIAESYDPQAHIAPIVVGHPQHDDPAYGWVQRLAYEAGRLRAEPIQVDPAFAEMVRAGRFRTISAAFYPPEHPGNPRPGGYYLRHVGFLGATPPAVKGLKSAEFSGQPEGIVEFEEPYSARWAMASVAALFRRLRDYFIDAVGLEKADEVMPDYLVHDMEEAANKMTETQSVNFSEEDDMSAEDKAKLAALAEENKKLKADKAEADKRAAEFAERERTIQAAEAAARKKVTAEFVEDLVKQGRLLPKDQAAVVEFMTALPEGEIEFADGDIQVKKPAAEWLRSFLAALPVQVHFAEHAGGAKTTLDTADADSIARRAQEYQDAEKKAGRSISTAQAVQHVFRGQ